VYLLIIVYLLILNTVYTLLSEICSESLKDGWASKNKKKYEKVGQSENVKELVLL